MSSSVAGFRPRRSFLSFTQNFPKPDISTSSPDSSVRLIISNRVLTVSVDFVYVFDMERTPLHIKGLRVNEPELNVKKLGVLIKDDILHLDCINLLFLMQ